jgi:hypothetical protein
VTRDHWKPKKPRWAIATALVAAASLAAYAAASRRAPVTPDRGLGLAFGIAAFTFLAADSLHPLRRLGLWPVRSAQTWLQLHIWGGLLTGLFVLLHARVRAPGGAMGWCLLALAAWVIATGLVGVVLQKFMPVMLAHNLSVEALFERIPELVGRLPAEADALMADGSDVLRGFYLADVRPALTSLSPSWSYLADVRGRREARLLAFARVTQFLTETEREKLEDLKTIYVEKLELDAHYSVQRALRAWPLIHVPAALLLLGLAVVHVTAFLVY